MVLPYIALRTTSFSLFQTFLQVVLFGAGTPAVAELVSNHPPCPHTCPEAGQICITPLSLIPSPGHGAIPHAEAAAELGAFLLPFSEPLPHPSGDKEEGRAAGSILSVGTSPAHTVPVLPFSSSASSLLTSNIQFAAFSAPGTLEAPCSMTPKIPFLGRDAPVRAHHWATSVRTGFCVFSLPFPEFLGCLAVPLLRDVDPAAPCSSEELGAGAKRGHFAGPALLQIIWGHTQWLSTGNIPLL